LPEFQLYNLNEDIAEENNLQDQYPEILLQYKEELSHIILSGRSTEGAQQKNDGPASWPQLDFLNQ